MARVFLTSDLHLGHKNLCSGLRNMSSEESDELIIKNWNSVVTKRDIVYVLGDIVMEDYKLLESYIKRLNGTIIVVGGNHDTKKCCRELQRLGIIVMGCASYKGYLLTHIPIHTTQLKHTRGNIHGHIHTMGTIDGEEYLPETELGPFYYNVNIELHNYTPIPFEVVEKEFEAKISEIGECERYPRKICPICPFVKRCVHQDLRIGKMKPLNEQE